MNKRQRRCLEIIQIKDITPHMRRITFAGNEYSDFPQNVAGSYIKLVFQPDTDQQSVRTYTIRQQRAESFDVDFVLHGDNGIASAWANHAQVGDQCHIGGPGKGQMINQDADWFFLAGDMTALPAISVNLEQLPTDARGHAVIQIESPDDVQDLELPKGINIQWVVAPIGDTKALITAIETTQWLNGRVAVWGACEFEGMRAMRRYFKQDRHVAKQDIYVSSYWKNGVAEDEHKKIKKLDSENNAA